MSTADQLQAAAQRIERQRQQLQRVHTAYRGAAPSAFMSEAAGRALSKKLRTLYVNFPRLVVNSLAERTQVLSFRRADSADSDMTLWKLWKLAGMESKSDTVHVDRALYGAAYVTIWGHRNNPARPVVMVDTPRTATVKTDPATGEVTETFRIWQHDGTYYGSRITPHTLQQYVTKSSDLSSAIWEPFTDAQSNPFGEVPTVPFIRTGASSELQGVSAVSDILDLTDALAKVLQDSLVTSEYHSRPRRWATGLEIEEDDDGKPIDPFGESRLMQSEDPETRFGQLPPADVTGYADLTAMVTQQIGALTGLPPHYLGLHGDQPPNADGVRAAETQLVSRAEVEKRSMSQPWAEVAAWMRRINTSSAELDDDILTVWDSSEIRTPAAAADAAGKLYDIGVPLRTLLRDPLRYEPHEIAQIMRDQGTDMAQRAAFGSLNRPQNGQAS